MHHVFYKYAVPIISSIIAGLIVAYVSHIFGW